MLGCPPGRCEPERLPLPLPFAATSSPLLLAGADAAFPPFFFPLAATLRHPPAVKAEPRNDTAPSAHDIAPRCCCFICPFALSDPAQWTSDTAFGFAGCRTADSVRPLGPFIHTPELFFFCIAKTRHVLPSSTPRATARKGRAVEAYGNSPLSFYNYYYSYHHTILRDTYPYS